MSREWTRRSIEELVKEYAIKNGYAGSGGEPDFKEVEYPYVTKDSELISCSNRNVRYNNSVYQTYFIKFTEYVDSILNMKQLIEDGYVPTKELLSVVPQDMTNVGEKIPYDYCYQKEYEETLNSFVCFYLPDGETIDGKKFYKTDLYTLMQHGVPYSTDDYNYIQYINFARNTSVETEYGTVTNTNIAYVDMNVIYRIFIAILHFITLRMQEVDPDFDGYPAYSQISFYIAYNHNNVIGLPFPESVAPGLTWDDIPVYINYNEMEET